MQYVYVRPNYLNAKYTIRGLKSGKNVFCEKPPALNAEEMVGVLEVEKETELTLMYGFNHRHHQSIKKIKSMIDGGEFGKILWMRGRYGKKYK